MFRKVRDTVLASTGGRQEPSVYGSLSSRGAYLTARPVLPDSLSSTDLLADSQSATDRLAAERLATERLSKEEELLYWESVKDSEEAAELHAYLDRYPNGAYEALARIRLKRLEGASDGSEPPESTGSAAPAQEAFSVPVPAESLSLPKPKPLGLPKPPRCRPSWRRSRPCLDPRYHCRLRRPKCSPRLKRPGAPGSKRQLRVRPCRSIPSGPPKR